MTDQDQPTTHPAENAPPRQSMPLWVKMFAFVGGSIVILIVVMLALGHGPGRHSHGGAGEPARATGVLVR